VLRASVLAKVGEVYRGLGLHIEAEPPIREAIALFEHELGGSHRETLLARVQLVDTLLTLGRYEEANGTAEATHEALRSLLGPDHIESLRASAMRAQALWLGGRYVEAGALYREVFDLSRRAFGDEHPDTLHALGQWAISEYFDLNAPEEAEPMLQRNLDHCRQLLGEDHPDTLRVQTCLAVSLERQRRFDEAESLFEDGIDKARRVLGDDHPDLLTSLVHFAVLRQRQGRLDEAEALCSPVVETARRSWGAGNPLTQWAWDRLGHILDAQLEFGEALSIHRQLLQVRRSFVGDCQHGTANSLDSVGVTLAHLGRWEEAEEAYREALSLHREALGEAFVPLGTVRGLVETMAARGKAEDARPLAIELLETRRQAAERTQSDAYILNCYARELLTIQPVDLRDPIKGLEYAQLAFSASDDTYHYSRYTLALALEANGRRDEAVAMLRRALIHIPIELSYERSFYEGELSRMLELGGEPDAAEDVYRTTVTARREQLGADHADVAVSLEDLGDLLIRHGKYKEAQQVICESLQIRVERPWHWRTAWSESLLGALLLRQGYIEQAESLLLDARVRLSADPGAPRQVVGQVDTYLTELQTTPQPPARTAGRPGDPVETKRPASSSPEEPIKLDDVLQKQCIVPVAPMDYGERHRSKWKR